MTDTINRSPVVCRICGGNELDPVLSLGELPLANGLLEAGQLGKPEPRFPLDLVLCRRCSLLQITATVPPEMLFRVYPYFSSFSDTMLQHAKLLAEGLVDSLNLTSNSLVVEVGSNDGYLLQYFQRMGIPVLGIEPATNIAEFAVSRGIPTLNEFFDDRLANSLRDEGKRADALIGNNVLAHVARLYEFVEGVRILLKPEGLAVFEAAYARDTVDHGEFDQIYHEHVCYYSLTSLCRLFDMHDLQIVDAEVMGVHGGSLRVYVRHRSNGQPTDRLKELLAEENKWGVDRLETYTRLVEAVDAKRRTLLTILREFRAAGRRIVAYGASAKGAIMLNAFGIGTDLVDYVVDRSPHKQGKYIPGCHLPIYPPERLLVDKPDYALMLAWNFREEVLEQMAPYRQAGGKFIIPIPALEIL